MASDAPIIVIKKVKKAGEAGHHGGQWKVAYADFVTAMMAFFLLMWLINTTSPQQKRGIADYFSPASVSETTSGSGGILGGASLSSSGTKSSGSKDIVQQLAPDAPPDVTDTGQSQTTSHQATQGSETKADDAALTSAAQSLRQAMQDMPELAELSKQIIVDQTPEGLRVQLVDQEGRSMFNEGSAVPNDRAKVLLAAVARVVRQLPNRITIAGHTSATPGGAKPAGDWGLSSARADAARALLQSNGVDPDRIYQVAGKASSDPLYPDDPLLPGNRRITITLLREAPVLPADAGP
jgi:chemotaxis protein MotB